MNQGSRVAAVLLAAIGLQSSHSQEAPHPIAGAQVPTTDFERTVVAFVNAYCTSCHGAKEPAGGLSLEDIDLNVSGRDFEVWRMIDERVRFGEMPPPESEQPTSELRRGVLKLLRAELLKTQQPGSAVQAKLKLPRYGNYVDHAALFDETPGPVTPGPPRVWRLRPEIYDEVVVGGRPALESHSLSSPLNVVSGSEIKDYADRYFIDAATAEILLANAEKIVQIRSRAVLETLTANDEPREETVAAAIRQTFQEVLYREPTAEELNRFAEFYGSLRDSSGQQLAAERLLIAIYMQPGALFREELGAGSSDEHGRLRLSQREIALAVSYALGNSPDPLLLDAARLGELAKREQIAAHVRRRWNSSRAGPGNPRILQFFREYFNYPHAIDIFKDQPSRGSYLRRVLVKDLDLLIEHIVGKDENVLYNLLTTQEYFVDCQRDPSTGALIQSSTDARNTPNYPGGSNPEYATVYGLPRDWIWTADQPLAMPPRMRAGVLTHPAWLVAWSGNTENHPVQRGKWVRTHLLGGTVPNVPIGVDAVVPQDRDRPFRKRLAQATAGSECQRCHRKMDPLGLPFEQYDHYGRYRPRELDAPVVTSGAITLVDDEELPGDVANPIELMQRLAKSEHVEQVFVRYAFRYFTGRNETLGDAATLQQAHRAYRDSGGSFRELVVSLLTSDSFLYRTAGEDCTFP